MVPTEVYFSPLVSLELQKPQDTVSTDEVSHWTSGSLGGGIGGGASTVLILRLRTPLMSWTGEQVVRSSSHEPKDRHGSLSFSSFDLRIRLKSLESDNL